MSGDLGNHIVSPVTSLSFSAFKLTIKSWRCKRMRKNHIIFQRSSKEQKKFYQLIVCTQRLGPLTLFISGHANFVNLMVLGTIRRFCGRSHLLYKLYQFCVKVPSYCKLPKYDRKHIVFAGCVGLWCNTLVLQNTGFQDLKLGDMVEFASECLVDFRYYVFHCLDSYFGTLNVLTLKWTFKSCTWNHPPKVTVNHVASIIWGIIWLRISGRFCAKYSWDESHAQQEQMMWTSTKKQTMY